MITGLFVFLSFKALGLFLLEKESPVFFLELRVSVPQLKIYLQRTFASYNFFQSFSNSLDRSFIVILNASRKTKDILIQGWTNIDREIKQAHPLDTQDTVTFQFRSDFEILPWLFTDVYKRFIIILKIMPLKTSEKSYLPTYIIIDIL